MDKKVVFLEKTYDVSSYDSQKSQKLGVKLNLCIQCLQTAVKMSGLQNLSESVVSKLAVLHPFIYL